MKPTTKTTTVNKSNDNNSNTTVLKVRKHYDSHCQSKTVFVAAFNVRQMTKIAKAQNRTIDDCKNKTERHKIIYKEFGIDDMVDMTIEPYAKPQKNPSVVMADKTPNLALIKYLNDGFASGKTEIQMIEELKNGGWTEKQLKATKLFKSMVVIGGIPPPPPTQMEM